MIKAASPLLLFSTLFLLTASPVLAQYEEGQKAFDSDAKDLPGLIAEFDTKFPALAQNVKDENGKLRRFINVYINDEDIRFLGGDTHQFEDGDEVMLIPSIAGGSYSDGE